LKNEPGEKDFCPTAGIRDVRMVWVRQSSELQKGVKATRGFSISWSGNSAVWHTGHTVSKRKQNKQQTKSTYATKDKIQNCSTL